jgi:hypothetical protein
MRNILIIIAAVLALTACKKNKFTTAPQISFKKISPNTIAFNNTVPELAPVLVIRVTDSEGDIGFKDGSDTARVYIKNLVRNKIDSVIMPDIKNAATKNFEADIVLNMSKYILCRQGGSATPRTDTAFYEIYVTDFAKNKSNIIRTESPVLITGCRN